MNYKGFKYIILGAIYLILLLLIGCGGGGSGTPTGGGGTTDTTLLSTPTGVTATAGNGQVVVSWTAVTGATSYKVYRGTTGALSTKTAIATNVTVATYTDTTASNGITYYYQVTAVNSNVESAGSNEVNATPTASTTTTPPSAPSGVSATGGNAQITISWAAVTGATSYNVYWSLTSGVTKLNGLKVASNITVTTFTDTIGLSNGTTYYYIVTAVNGYGESAESVQVSATPTSIPASSVTLSGTVTYTHYSVNQTTGIDYSFPTEKPIRGAVVALQNSSGTVLASANTTQTGSYSFSAPTNSTVRIVVMAALGSPDAPRVTVVDNTNGGASYGTYFDVTTGTTNLTANFNANSGWDGVSYSGVRAAAPFAVLDTIYQAEVLIKSADPNVQFPALVVNWSKTNKPTDGDKTIGEIGTSHYLAGNLYILGAENLDTDEYDTHVMAHEWGHYFEDKLGRSDNIGGVHGGGDILDPRVAFGEGWGNALAGMVFNDPLYIDTNKASQASVGPFMNLDTNSTATGTQNGNGILIDGFYSEASIQEVLYDLYKTLGFKPIYDVMVGGQKTTSAYTTIFSFLKYLKDANPTYSTDIASLTAAENINAGDEYEAFTWPIYTVVPVNGTIVTTNVDGIALQTFDINGPITASSPGNKLYNRMFFKFYIPSTGSHTIEVAPTGGGNVCFQLNEKGVKTLANNCDIGVTASMTKSFTTGNYVMEVLSLGGPATFTVKIN